MMPIYIAVKYSNKTFWIKNKIPFSQMKNVKALWSKFLNDITKKLLCHPVDCRKNFPIKETTKITYYNYSLLY